LGSYDFRGGHRIAVKRIIRHEQYNTETQDNDLALLELAAEPQDKSRLELIQLVDQLQDEPRQEPGRSGLVLGWGSAQKGLWPAEFRHAEKVLRYTDEIQFKSSEECNQYHVNEQRTRAGEALRAEGKSQAQIRATLNSRYPSTTLLISDNMVCAGTNDGSRDSCFGDSGGPLVVDRKRTPVQVGVVSWGPAEGCGLTNLFGVYVRLSRYLDWINSRMH
jgi:secreted trypsin-like serine protease